MNSLIPVAMWLAAATSTSDPVTACREAHSADPSAHIACLEAALGHKKAPAAAPEGTNGASSTSAPDKSADTKSADARGAGTEGANPKLADNKRSASNAGPAPATPQAAADASDFGSDQLPGARRAEPDRPQSVSVVVTSVTYLPDGRGLFRLANGQVWREVDISPRSARLKVGEQYTGRIERGKIGGYRMYLDGVKRMLKVQRLE